MRKLILHDNYDTVLSIIGAITVLIPDTHYISLPENLYERLRVEVNSTLPTNDWLIFNGVRRIGMGEFMSIGKVKVRIELV